MVEVTLGVVGGLLGQDHPDPGRVFVETAQHPRHQRGGHRVEEGEPDDAPVRVEPGLELEQQLVVANQGVTSRGHHELAVG